MPVFLRLLSAASQAFDCRQKRTLTAEDDDHVARTSAEESLQERRTTLRNPYDAVHGIECETLPVRLFQRARLTFSLEDEELIPFPERFDFDWDVPAAGVHHQVDVSDSSGQRVRHEPSGCRFRSGLREPWRIVELPFPPEGGQASH